MAGPKRVPAVEPSFVELEVLDAFQLSPHLRRVTLGGEGVTRMTPQGFDQWFRFFMRRDGQDALRIPASPERWFPEYLRIAPRERPWVRNYTVRDFRVAEGELDVDFVVHEDPGPGAAWAQRATVGERAVLLDEGLLYNDEGLGGELLLVGDESAIPAIAGVCESLPARASGLAVIEIGHHDDRQEFRAPAGVRVEWVHRGAERPGQAGIRALQDSALPTSLGYAYAAGEQALAAGTRRHLVKQGVDKRQITFTGYWKLGKAYVD